MRLIGFSQLDSDKTMIGQEEVVGSAWSLKQTLSSICMPCSFMKEQSYKFVTRTPRSNEVHAQWLWPILLGRHCC